MSSSAASLVETYTCPARRRSTGEASVRSPSPAVAPYTHTVLASSTRSTPPRRAASSTRAVPSTFSRTALAGSCATMLTSAAPARWKIACVPATASSSAAASNRSAARYRAAGLRHPLARSITTTSCPARAR